MSWLWRSEPQSRRHQTPAGLDRQFSSQGDAESWLGEFYPDLLHQGVRAVSLYEEDRKVYGPMSLEPEP